METTQEVKVLAQAAFYRNLKSSFKEGTAAPFIPSSDTPKLIPFNGYYTLNGAGGAFFAIDTNVYVSDGGKTAVSLITFYLSLDGDTSSSYQFSSGTFDGENLLMNAQGINLNLTFTRLENQEQTVSFSGQLCVGNGAMISVSGYTYNNPIESSLFQGTYYLTPALPSQPVETTPIMKIGAGNELSYDYNLGNGQLQLVESYIYNMNMYYFQFSNGNANVQLIMGTAGGSGFACNDMVTGSTGVSSRNLQTIQTVNRVNADQFIPNANSEALAAFSGYYPLSSIHPFAFLSILGQYTVLFGKKVYSVTMAYSFDGVNATSYYFQTTGMTFEDNVLVLVDAFNKPFVNLQFQRKYDPQGMMLVEMTGCIETYENLTAYTPFNPVPLTAFGGKAMTNATGEAITIVSDTDVSYTLATGVNMVVMDNFIYVPLMYILAGPWYAPATVFSLGTSKENGNVSIVIDVATTKTTFVQAIPSPPKKE